MSVFVQPDRYGDGEPLEELQTNPHFDSDGTRPLKRPKRSAIGDRGPHSSDPFLNSSLSSSDHTSRSSVGGVASVRLSHPFTMNNTLNINGYLYSPPPPSTSDLLASLDDLNIPSKIYRSPYYSKESDAPERSREYAGLLYHLKGGEGLANLDDWDDGLQKGKAESLRAVNPAGVGGWEYASSPPSVKTVKTWLMFDNGKSSSGPKRSNPQSQVSAGVENKPAALNSPLRLKVLHKRSKQHQT
jgi:DNA polymerase zeta